MVWILCALRGNISDLSPAGQNVEEAVWWGKKLIVSVTLLPNLLHANLLATGTEFFATFSLCNHNRHAQVLVQSYWIFLPSTLTMRFTIPEPLYSTRSPESGMVNSRVRNLFLLLRPEQSGTLHSKHWWVVSPSEVPINHSPPIVASCIYLAFLLLSLKHLQAWRWKEMPLRPSCCRLPSKECQEGLRLLQTLLQLVAKAHHSLSELVRSVLVSQAAIPQPSQWTSLFWVFEAKCCKPCFLFSPEAFSPRPKLNLISGSSNPHILSPNARFGAFNQQNTYKKQHYLHILWNRICHNHSSHMLHIARLKITQGLEGWKL